MSAESSKAKKLRLFVCIWYAFNARYNVVNKLVLKSLPGTSATLAISWVQLSSGMIVGSLMWMCGLQPAQIKWPDIVKLVPASICFATGQISTQLALANGDVSLTHVVKSLEPAINAVASAALLGQCFHCLVYTTLIPIVVGVYLTTKSSGFNSATLWLAMLSNVCFALRNVFAQKHGQIEGCGENTETRQTNLFFLMTIIGSMISLPGIVFGFPVFMETWSEATNHVSSLQLFLWLSESCVQFSFYQLSSFWVLSLVQPLSHSVLNSLKRVVVIMTAVLLLHEHVTPVGIAGVIVTTCGAIMYSLAKRTLQGGTNTDPKGWKFIAAMAMAVVALTCFAGVGGDLEKNTMVSKQIMAAKIQQHAVSDLFVVPIQAFSACNGKIQHLTCLQVLIVKSMGSFDWAEHLIGPLCEKILAGRETASFANVGLCLQFDGQVGVIVRLQNASTDPVHFTTVPFNFQQCTIRDLQMVNNLLPDKPRIVSRKNVFFFPRDKSKSLNYSNHSKAWESAMALDQNLGNFVWEFGARRLWNPFTTVIVDPSLILPDAFLAATANLLYVESHGEGLPKSFAGLTKYLIMRVETLNVPSVFLGIGLQAELPLGKNDEQQLAHAIKGFHFNNLSVKLLDAFASRAPRAGKA